MMIENGDGTFTAGKYDAILILHDVNTGRYHVAFFEEAMFPGGIEANDNLDVVRLKSKMHHTAGADTLEGAIEHLEDMRKKILVPEQNVWREPREWDGQIGIVCLIPKSEFSVHK